MVTILVQPLTEAEKKHRELLLASDEYKDLYPYRRQNITTKLQQRLGRRHRKIDLKWSSPPSSGTLRLLQQPVLECIDMELSG